ERRGQRTYGELTIAKALEGRTEFYTPDRDGPRAGHGNTADGHLRDLHDSPDWPQPLPLGVIPAAAPFPLEVVPKQILRLVKEIARACNCPVDFAGVPLLAMAGAAVGNSLRLAITKSHKQSASLYAALVNRPGSGKSPVFTVLREPFDKAQARMLDE